MDPLSVTASIIAVLQLSAKVLSYLNDVNDVSKDRAQCAIEASNLHSLLLNLRFRLEEGDASQPWYIAVRALAVENGPLDQFKQALETLQAKITDGGRLKKAGEALMWRFKKEDIASIMARMERLKTLIEIALQMDHFKLSQAIRDDTNFLRTQVPVFQSRADTIRQEQDSAKHYRLLEWVSASDYPLQQSDIIKRRQEGTGQWFLDAPEVARWLKETGTTLFCPGIPGAGKTMIAAIAIDHLLKLAQSSSHGVAYVYCNYKAQEEQDVSSLLAAILKQLVQDRLSTVEHIEWLHQKHASKGTKPSLDEINNTLRDVLAYYPTVHIVIDALDECQDGTRHQFLAKLRDLRAGRDVRLMVTARSIPDIEDAFKGALRLKVQASEEDVKRFVAGQIYRLPGCIQRDPALQDLVQARIVDAVDGMFLLARLHTDSLLDKRTVKDVKTTLVRLTKGAAALDAMYREAIQRIEGQLDTECELAKRVLSWITFAKRPLTTAEICCVLAVEPDKAEIDSDNVYDSKDLISVCAGLVVIDQGSSVIRFVHYTTQDYFERTRDAWNPGGQLHMASQHALAGAYQANGQVKEAVSLLQQVVQIKEQILAEDHPSRLASQYALAGAYQANRQVKEAVSLLEQVVQIQEQTLAEEHPDRLASQHALATAYQANRQVKEAVSLLEQVVQIQEQTLAEDHPSRLVSQHELAVAYRANGQIKQAVSLLQQVVQIKKQILAEDHPSRLASQHALATAYQANGQVKEAVSLLEQVVQIQEQTLAEDHPDRLALQHELRRLEDATDMNKKKRSILGEEHPAAAQHEAGWEEDSDSVSDLSEVSSAQSMPSLVSDSSSASLRDKYGPEAAEHLAGLLVEDPILNSLYAAAIPKIDSEKFHKNHDQLLKAFFKDLRPETRNTVELATVRGLRSRDRRQKITSLIRNTFEPPNILKQQAMTILRDQRPNRMQVLNDYLGELASDYDPKHSNVAYGQDDESGDGGGNSNSSNENDDRPMWQNDEETNVHLEPLELFITKSNAFARFKSNFGYLLRPPTHLSEALDSRDIYIVERFLAKNFTSAATSDHEWLHELDEAGYSKQEIAELLLENTNDSPWIYFTPRAHVRCHIQNNFHVPDCAHVANTSNKPQSLPYSGQAHPSILHTDLRRQVEELCGIGGVIPSSRDMSSWHGSVTFEKQSSASSITYAATSPVMSQTRRGILVRISSVLDNFCTTAAAVQANRLCCDAFTALLHIQDSLNLRRVELYHATKMASYMHEALEDDSTEAAIRHCAQSAKHILQGLIESLPNTTPDDDLHYCALAAQFLCVAFLSYTQAHVGPVDLFFFDTPQQEMVLLGSQHILGDSAIKAELVKLTCLADMTQQPVLAFSSVAKSGKLRGGSEFDVLSNAEDFLDTWGPGYFVHNKVNPSKVHAIALDRGYVFLADSETLHFHWTTGRLPESALRATFEPRTMMRIGAPVRINVNCYIDEAACRKSSFCALEQLGTHEIFWEPQERQAGFQGGQYINGSLLQTWKKSPGTTLKQSRLQQNDWRLIEFLEQSWGLQVSFCTSVARRVSLRELVTDLLPIFVTPLGQNDWQELVDRHHIIQAFSQGDLGTWLRPLSLSLQGYVLNLVGKILRQLQHTGFDRRNTTLVIAWPQEGDTERGLKIPCKEQTYWAQILADAEDCATFAYVTPKCLETNHVKCQGSLRAWQNTSKMMVTEMSPSRPKGEPVITTALAPVTATATTTTQWELEDKKIYFVKKLDTLLQVKVERPNSSSNDVAHLVVADSIIPPGWWKRVLLKEEQKRNHRIRERQAIGDHAERVIVRAG